MSAAVRRWWSQHLVCGSDPGKGSLGVGWEGAPSWPRGSSEVTSWDLFRDSGLSKKASSQMEEKEGRRGEEKSECGNLFQVTSVSVGKGQDGSSACQGRKDKSRKGWALLVKG